MIIVPAIDIEAGRVVKRRQGRPGTGSRDLGPPGEWLGRWAGAGARRVHLVDLDAAAGRGTNRAVVAELLGQAPCPIQCGGGIRSFEDAEELLAAGADRVVVASRAWSDRTWLAEAAARFGDRLVVAVDVAHGRLRVQGWDREGPPLDEALALAQRARVRRILLTDVDREGSGEGPDLELLARVRAGFSGAIGVAGGVARRAELVALAGAGAEASILGRALYEGDLPRSIVAEEF